MDDHWEDAERHSMKDDLRVPDGTDAHVGDRGCLPRHGERDSCKGSRGEEGRAAGAMGEPMENGVDERRVFMRIRNGMVGDTERGGGDA